MITRSVFPEPPIKFLIIRKSVLTLIAVVLVCMLLVWWRYAPNPNTLSPYSHYIQNHKLQLSDHGKPVKVLLFYGTRPEAVKMAPLIEALRSRPFDFNTTVCVTGQHREMLRQINEYFGIVPDIDLDIMTPDQSLAGMTVDILKKVTGVIKANSPNLVIVQGDTTTAFTAALAAFYEKVPIAHVEAGLRTGNMYNPFPEEMNRKLIGSLATYNFAATQEARVNLLQERADPQSVFLTGNTVIDAITWAGKQAPSKQTAMLLSSVGILGPDEAREKRFILLTAHRRENLGPPLEGICQAVLALAKAHPDVTFVFPVHLNPNVRKVVFSRLEGHDRIKLIDPVGYEDMVHLMKRSYFIMTDSGGVQEEATAFGKPVLVLRLTTERYEGVLAGAAKLVGVDQYDIVDAATRLLNDRRLYAEMSKVRTVYGDGHAAERMVQAFLGLPVAPFNAPF